MEVKERIAYVRGLMDGASTQSDPSTRALWDNLLQVCDGLADSIHALTAAQSETEEYVEALDEDLCQLEADFYGNDEEVSDDDTAYEDAEDDSDDSVVRAECPRCGEEAFFDEAYLYDENVEISCPECGEILYRSGEHDVEFDDNNHAVDHDVYYPASERVDYGSAQFSPDN